MLRSQQRAGKSRTETLDYLHSMLGQLRAMAESERCDMLAYLIEMAYIEANDIIRGERPARVGPEPSRKRADKRNGAA